MYVWFYRIIRETYLKNIKQLNFKTSTIILFLVIFKTRYYQVAVFLNL